MSDQMQYGQGGQDPSRDPTERLPVVEQGAGHTQVTTPAGAPEPGGPPRRGGTLPWVLAGCFALLLVALVVGIAVYYVVLQQSRVAEMARRSAELRQQLESIQGQVATLTGQAAQEPTEPTDRPGGEQPSGGSAGSGASGGSGGSGGVAVDKESGTNPGEVKKVFSSGGTEYLTIDNVQFLTGQKAIDAAVADGVIAPGDPLENDYYVRNESKKLRTFRVSSSVKVTLWKMQGYQSGSYSDFKGVYEQFLWWVTVKDGTVTEIKAQYTP